MPVKKRRLKQLRGRIVKCTSADQFEKLKSKHNDRLVFVHFFKSTNLACKRMSAYLSEVSRKAEYSHVVFAELDIDQVEDAVKLYDVKGLPGVQCWKNGQLLMNTVLSHSLQIMDALNKYAGERPSGGLWVKLLKVALLGAMAAGGWFAYSTVSSKARQWELQAIDRQISAAKQLLEGKRRRRKSKEVRAAKKKLEMLQQRKEELMKESVVSVVSVSDGGPLDYSDDEDSPSRQQAVDLSEDEDGY